MLNYQRVPLEHDLPENALFWDEDQTFMPIIIAYHRYRQNGIPTCNGYIKLYPLGSSWICIPAMYTCILRDSIYNRVLKVAIAQLLSGMHSTVAYATHDRLNP